MNNLNSILLEGNLVKDPEIKNSPQGHPFCQFSLATNRSYRKNTEFVNEVSYIPVTTWGKEAQRCAEHLTRGRGVRIVGRIKQDRWVDGDGKNRSRVHVIADHVEFSAKKEASFQENSF